MKTWKEKKKKKKKAIEPKLHTPNPCRIHLKKSYTTRSPVLKDPMSTSRASKATELVQRETGNESPRFEGLMMSLSSARFLLTLVVFFRSALLQLIIHWLGSRLSFAT